MAEEIKRMIKLYTINCPKCIILEKKLNNKNIKYETIIDQKIMEKKGFLSMPILEVDGKIMLYKEAIEYVNSL